MEMFHRNKSSKFCEDDKSLLYGSTETDSLGDSDIRTVNCVNADAEHGKQDNAQDFANHGGERDLFESAEMVPAGCAVSNKTDGIFLDSGSLWDGSESTEPWWRSIDRDELALLVSQRSFGLVENCDLPRPQRTYAKVEEAFADFRDGTLSPSKDPKYPGVSEALIKRPVTSVDVSLQAVTSTTNHLSTVRGAISERNIGENDPGKAVLLEALCHSQTRARGAETAAKEAHAEKEDVMKLVFRQASQLFAYKHWFQLLQLESKQNEPISTLLPAMLPWTTPQKAKPAKPRKSWQKICRGKRAGKKGCLSNYAVAIALGLSLVGAGLLLGWTVGCFLPAL